MSNKKNILFIGSFKKNKGDRNVGGQMFACDTLVNSKLSNKVKWLLIDTTASTNKARSFKERLDGAISRISKFIYYLFSKQVDVVLLFSAHGFSFLEKGSMALIAKLFGKSVVLAPRSGYIIDDSEASFIRRNFIKTVLIAVDRVICQSEYWQNYFFNLTGNKDAEKYCIIQNWIDTDAYLLPKEKNHKAGIHVLFMAWVVKDKGILDLIEAASGLQAKFPNIKYHIAGDGVAMEKSKNLVREKKLTNQFVFHGWVKGKDKINLLKKVDVFVLPSYYEGLPNSLLEAMASSLTVIATRVGSIPDLVENGANGLLFNKGNTKALSECIQLVFEDNSLRELMANNARETVLKNNTLDIAISKFAKIFKEI